MSFNEAALVAWFKFAWPGPITRGSTYLFACGEALHFIGLCMLFGSLIFVDLRIMGFYKSIPVKATLAFLPYAIIGFLINLATGWIFFTSAPSMYIDNPAFLWKMSFIVLAGLNALVFTIWELPKVARLGPGEDAPILAKTLAAGSLTIWLIVLLLGRWLPIFTVGTN